MGRPVILGNGALTVGLNENGLVHDFYYPYVGLNNLTNARSTQHKIGVWVDGKFSWTDDGSWKCLVDFETDALISKVRMVNNELNVSLELEDFVDSDINLFGRQIKVSNSGADKREIRVFLHQVFQISNRGRGDTALYVPEENYILDYKGRCSLLIYSQTTDDGQAYDQFAIGNYGIEGKEGTFKDAEDGELSGSAVEHGGVDSVMRFTRLVDAHSDFEISYWIIAADSQYNVEKLHHNVVRHGLPSRLDSTRHYWKRWLSAASNGLHRVDSKYLNLTKKSLMLIKAHADRRGGIIASCDSSIYNYGRDYYSYVWPRDGAYAIWPLIRLGYKEEARHFFEFCRDIMTTSGYLMHKYQPDRAIGSTWHPLMHRSQKELAIQEDETAIVLFMLGEYYDHSGDDDFVRSLYDTFIQPAANFLAQFTDKETGLPHASYDLWEEKFLTTAYSTAAAYQALLAAADFAEHFEYPDDALRWNEAAQKLADYKDVFTDPDSKTLRKGFYLNRDSELEFDNTLDTSSLYGSFIYGYYHDRLEVLHNTASRIQSELADPLPSGGVARYQGDNYFLEDDSKPGNPWFVCTLWMAQYYLRCGQKEKSAGMIDWVMDKCGHSGVLSEQLDPNTSEPKSVAPLVWSHAEFVNTVLDLSKVD